MNAAHRTQGAQRERNWRSGFLGFALAAGWCWACDAPSPAPDYEIADASGRAQMDTAGEGLAPSVAIAAPVAPTCACKPVAHIAWTTAGSQVAVSGLQSYSPCWRGLAKCEFSGLPPAAKVAGCVATFPASDADAQLMKNVALQVWDTQGEISAGSQLWLNPPSTLSLQPYFEFTLSRWVDHFGQTCPTPTGVSFATIELPAAPAADVLDRSPQTKVVEGSALELEPAQIGAVASWKPAVVSVGSATFETIELSRGTLTRNLVAIWYRETESTADCPATLYATASIGQGVSLAQQLPGVANRDVLLGGLWEGNCTNTEMFLWCRMAGGQPVWSVLPPADENSLCVRGD